MWFDPSPEEAQAAAKLIAGSWVGAIVTTLWRKGMAFWERAAWHICSLLAGLVLGAHISNAYDLPLEVSGFAAGLLGVTLAFRLLRMADKFDLAGLVKFMMGGK